jgi:hypothetical protein
MGVPSLVRVATAHSVGAHCIVLVSRSLFSPDCTHVVLVDPMTLGLAIVPQERLVPQAPPPRSWCQRQQRAALVLSQSICKLLVGSCKQGDQHREQQVGSHKLLKYCGDI